MQNTTGATARQTITVSNTQELEAAYLTLQAKDGGGVIELKASSTPYSINFRDMGDIQNAVTITSADANAPATFSRAFIRDTDNITIDNVLFDSTNGGTLDDLEIYSSDNISIVNSEFIGNATGFITSYSERGVTLGSARWSDNFNFSGNTVSNYYHGLAVIDGSDITVSDNDISKMQGDGLRFASVQEVDIIGNTLHDFYGTSQNVTHSDMIQFWGTNANQITRDVEIRDNVLNTAGGAGSQGIFIRNELFGNGKSTGEYFQDFDITGNIIYNTHTHGIYVADVNDLLISANTVLWNRQAEILNRNGELVSQAPTIVIRNDGDVEISNNITESIVGTSDDSATIIGNIFVEYKNTDAANHIAKHFVNAYDGGAVDLRDLRLLDTSAWNGQAGAAGTQAKLTTTEGVEAILVRMTDNQDAYTMDFDARLSLDTSGFVDPDDYEFIWSFSDGSSLTGVTVEKTVARAGDYEVTLAIRENGTVVDSIKRDFLVPTKDILRLQSDNGVIDLSDKGISVTEEGQVEGAHDGFRISTQNEILVSAGVNALQKIDTIGIALDMKWANEGEGGNFITLHTVFQGRIYDDGRVWFEIETDEGRFAMISDTPVLSDGDWHRIGVSYDAYAKQLVMYVDGKEAASVAASGITGSSSQDLVFGNVWDRDTANIYLDNVEISMDPTVAGGKGAVSPDNSGGGGAVEPPPATGNEILNLSAAEGFKNLADSDAEIYKQGNVEGAHAGFRISNSQEIYLDSSAQDLRNMDSFALTLNMKLAESDASGNFVNYYQQFSGSVKDDGRVWFGIETDEGTFAMISDTAIFGDGGWHSIGIFYDSDSGKLIMHADGEEVASVAATGTIRGASQDLVLGNLWDRKTVDAYIDDIRLSDGSDGPVVSPPDTPGQTAPILEMSSAQGLKDLSGSGVEIYQVGNTLGDHVGFRISNDSEVYLDSSYEGLRKMDSFELNLDMRLADAGASGNFVNYYQQFSGSVKEDGRVWFGIETDEGAFAMISDEAIFDDGSWHQITITYDDTADYLTMYADGREVAQTQASGIIKGASQDLVLGNMWSGRTVDAYIDNLSLGAEPDGVNQSQVLDHLAALNLLTADEIIF